MAISDQDISRCKTAFAAFCMAKNRNLIDITNVVAGRGHMLVCFNGASLSKALPLPSNDAAGDMVVWQNHIEPLLSLARR